MSRSRLRVPFGDETTAKETCRRHTSANRVRECPPVRSWHGFTRPSTAYRVPKALDSDQAGEGRVHRQRSLPDPSKTKTGRESRRGDFRRGEGSRGCERGAVRRPGFSGEGGRYYERCVSVDVESLLYSPICIVLAVLDRTPLKRKIEVIEVSSDSEVPLSIDAPRRIRSSPVIELSSDTESRPTSVIHTPSVVEVCSPGVFVAYPDDDRRSVPSCEDRYESSFIDDEDELEGASSAGTPDTSLPVNRKQTTRSDSSSSIVSRLVFKTRRRPRRAVESSPSVEEHRDENPFDEDGSGLLSVEDGGVGEFIDDEAEDTSVDEDGEGESTSSEEEDDSSSSLGSVECPVRFRHQASDEMSGKLSEGEEEEEESDDELEYD